jgi:hypothetical protein
MGIPNIHSNQWTRLTIKNWWSTMTDGPIPNSKAFASLTLLVTWDVWNERNTQCSITSMHHTL